MGFKGGGQEFVLPDDQHWALLGIQRSRWSDSKGLEFTIQLTVANRKTWEQLQCPARLLRGAAELDEVLRADHLAETDWRTNARAH